MRISTKKYARALYEAFKEPHGKKQEEVIGGFVKILADQGLLGKAEKIVSDFINYYNEKEGIVRIDITASRSLDKETEISLVKKLEKLLVKKIEVKKYEDKNILGGMVLRYGDIVLDASLKSQLEILEGKLKA